MSKEKIEKTMDFLSSTYQDPQVKGNPELEKMIFTAAHDLEKQGDANLIAAQLCDEIAIYVLGHQRDCPRSLIDLFNHLKPAAAKYKGIAVSCMMMPIWF